LNEAVTGGYVHAEDELIASGFTIVMTTVGFVPRRLPATYTFDMVRVTVPAEEDGVHALIEAVLVPGLVVSWYDEKLSPVINMCWAEVLE